MLDQNSALISNSVALLIAFVFMILGGKLSDTYGRKPLLIIGVLMNAAICIPAYMVASQGSLASAIIGQSMLAVGCGLFWGPVGIALLELFPTRTRFSASAISYNMAYTIFGGTAPFIGVWLIMQTGNKFAPAYYMAAISVAVLVAILFMPETSKKSLIHDEDVN